MGSINSAGLSLIKNYEGLRLTAYQDSVGVWTIGYGHTGKVDGKSVCKGMTITSSKAEELLKSDTQKFYDYTCNTSYVPVATSLTENQRAALTSFAFNCGQSNLKTLCKNRSVSEIADAMLLYNKAGGKVLSGLTARRKAERTLYLNGYTMEEKNMDTLRKGDKGQQVRALQKLLGGLTVDGSFGSKTEEAVIAWQNDYGLDPDGIVGPKTWGKLLGE